MCVYHIKYHNIIHHIKYEAQLMFISSSQVHTEKSYRSLIKSNPNQIVLTIFRLIWNSKRTRSFAVPNQSENGKYNVISVWFNKISKKMSLCALAFFVSSRPQGSRLLEYQGLESGPLKRLSTTLLWCTGSFMGNYNWAYTRGTSLSGGCAPNLYWIFTDSSPTEACEVT